MTCCEPFILNFANVPSSVINYTAAMQEMYGPKPNVQVYFKEGAEYALSDDMNQVKFDGVNISIDYGGPAYGFVKVF